VDRDQQEQQDDNVNRDRERERPQQESQRAPDLVEPRELGFGSVGLEDFSEDLFLPLRHRAVEDQGDHDGRHNQCDDY